MSAVNSYLYDTMVRRYVLQYIFPKGEGGQPDRGVIGRALQEMPAQLAVLERADRHPPERHQEEEVDQLREQRRDAQVSAWLENRLKEFDREATQIAEHPIALLSRLHGRAPDAFDMKIGVSMSPGVVVPASIVRENQAYFRTDPRSCS